MDSFRNVVSELWAFRVSIVTFLTPLLFLFMPLTWRTQAASCAFIMIWMALYWVTEVYPIAITALMPVVLFPMFKIMSGTAVAEHYMKDSQMLFMGGLTVAVAVEHCNLHKRIALRVLMLVGSQVRWLMFGFMAVSFFLSMWISNTATSAMMVPIVAAVLQELMKASRQNTSEDKPTEPIGRSVSQVTVSSRDESSQQIIGVRYQKNEASSANLVEEISFEKGKQTAVSQNPEPTKEEKEDDLSLTPWGDVPLEEYEKFPHQSFTIIPGHTQGVENHTLCRAMFLCICYAANIGGTATLTGTPPNLVLSGQVESLYGVEISFTDWLWFALPNALICVLVAWVWLQFYFLGYRTLFSCCYTYEAVEDRAGEVIREQYEALGPMKFSEGIVLANFVLLVVLWLTRLPSANIPGWADLFQAGYGDKNYGYVRDGMAAIFVVLLLFCCPSERPNFLCCASSDDTSKKGPRKTVISWDVIHEKLPWSVIFLMGGGYALAAGVQDSGLSKEISCLLSVLHPVHPFWITLILCVVVAALTEFASNTATATIMIPIIAELASSLGVHPYYFLYPAVIAASFAFMLPVATPPNAIVFAYGTLRISDMAKAGVAMNIACCIIVAIVARTFGYYAFDWDDFPDWAVLGVTNTTQC